MKQRKAFPPGTRRHIGRLLLAGTLALAAAGCDDEAPPAGGEVTETSGSETNGAEVGQDVPGELSDDVPPAETVDDTNDAADFGPDEGFVGDDGTIGDVDPDAPQCSGVGQFTVCKEGVTDKVYKTDSCGNPTTVKTSCSPSTICEVNSGDGQAYCACPLTGELTCKNDSISGLYTLYTDTYLAKERACASAVPDPSDKVESCGFGTVCFQEEGFNDGVALCHRSLTETAAESPYYDHGCATFSKYLRHPTNLAIDCRCRYKEDGAGGPGGTSSAGVSHVDPSNTDIDNGGYPGGPIINCAQAGSMKDKPWPVKYGEGPQFNAWLKQNASGASFFSGGFNQATREMYSIMKWTNPQYTKSATIVAWNVDTGDRRIISGLYPNPQFGQESFGSGYLSPKVAVAGPPAPQPLTGANVLRFAADGMIYTYGGGTGEGSSNTREIVRTDPATGERTLMWLAQNGHNGDQTANWGQCFRPDALGTLRSVAFQAHGFEVGPDGTFYLSMHGVNEGDGIIAISADGQTCTPLSRWGGQGDSPGGGATAVPAPTPIGGGFDLQFPVQGLLFHDGAIYGVSNSNLYRFDLETGDRSKSSYTESTFEGMGFANMFWDPTREVIWAVGDHSKHQGAIIDLTNGRREQVYADSEYGPDSKLLSVYGTAQSVSQSMLGNGHSINYGAFVLDPENNDIVYAVLKAGGLMKMELSTFNNYVISY